VYDWGVSTQRPVPLGPAVLRVRAAAAIDRESVRRIYNEGIADRIATLDEDLKSEADIDAWFDVHTDRYAVLVAEDDVGSVRGWASLNPYSHRCAYRGVADLSIYVSRDARGYGIGSLLLAAIEAEARANAFHKVVLFMLAFNEPAQRLYRKSGYREVGTFREQGRLDGSLVDIVAMEKILA
jgi:L-amino acid N-acyltransferase YncA